MPTACVHLSPRSSCLSASEFSSEWGLSLLDLEHLYVGYTWTYFSYDHICFCLPAKYFGIGSNYIGLISWKFASWNQLPVLLNSQSSGLLVLKCPSYSHKKKWLGFSHDSEGLWMDPFIFLEHLSIQLHESVELSMIRVRNFVMSLIRGWVVSDHDAYTLR